MTQQISNKQCKASLKHERHQLNMQCSQVSLMTVNQIPKGNKTQDTTGKGQNLIFKLENRWLKHWQKSIESYAKHKP